jgi:hypothetical protein
MDYTTKWSHLDENHPVTTPDVIEDVKREDRGYNKLARVVNVGSNVYKKKKIDVYSSGDIGSNIRDAETGKYYSYRVGSKDEYLFFKTVMATGECSSKNGSSVLFYLSPQHYMSHLNVELSPKTISKWEERKNARLHELENDESRSSNKATVVR